ncbi:MAG: glycosyltransferase family 2 protein [Blastocatellia bacterium]
MESFFYLLSLILFLQSLLALAAALRFARYSLRTPSARHRYQPKAVVIVPCKGIDPGFEENIGSLFAQDYRDYEIIFVTERESDPAYETLTDLIRQSRRSAWLVVAGEATGCGQKIHNLRAALDTLDAVNRRAEIIVFADADARPAENWLSELVAPLADESVGATTGYRWYLPAEGSQRRFWPLLLSVWNAGTLTLFGERSAFAWGGAMAVRRDYFEQSGIREKWAAAVSDDYVLTDAIKTAGQRVKFVPACLVATPFSGGFREMLEFTTRQVTITRVYAPRLWRLALVTHLLFNLTFWGGILLSVIKSVSGDAPSGLIWLLAGIFSLGALAGAVRAVVAARLLEEDHHQIAGHWWAWLLLNPVASLLWLYNVCASALTRRITWRGIGYELSAPDQTLIWQRDQSFIDEELRQQILRPDQAQAHSTPSELR